MILRFFTQNAGWKLLSLVVAIAYWMTVASEPELATIVSVPVQYRNFPKDLDISSEIQDSVDIEARGMRGRLRDLADSKTAAVLDFASVTEPGVRTFSLTDNEIKVGRGIELIRIIPAQLRFTFERKMERLVPVTVNFSGKLPAGLQLDSDTITPPQLTVSGPESHVRRVTVVQTDPFDLNHVTGNTEQTLAVFVDQPQVHLNGNSPRVLVRIKIRKN